MKKLNTLSSLMLIATLTSTSTAFAGDCSDTYQSALKTIESAQIQAASGKVPMAKWKYELRDASVGVAGESAWVLLFTGGTGGLIAAAFGVPYSIGGIIYGKQQYNDAARAISASHDPATEAEFFVLQESSDLITEAQNHEYGPETQKLMSYLQDRNSFALRNISVIDVQNEVLAENKSGALCKLKDPKKLSDVYAPVEAPLVAEAAPNGAVSDRREPGEIGELISPTSQTFGQITASTPL
jgi:hypothetical protein